MNNIKKILREKKLSVKKFADIIGATTRSVDYWIAGRFLPNAKYLERIQEVDGFENIKIKDFKKSEKKS